MESNYQQDLDLQKSRLETARKALNRSDHDAAENALEDYRQNQSTQQQQDRNYLQLFHELDIARRRQAHWLGKQQSAATPIVECETCGTRNDPECPNHNPKPPEPTVLQRHEELLSQIEEALLPVLQSAGETVAAQIDIHALAYAAKQAYEATVRV